MATESYTRDQIEKGEGCLTQVRTAIYERPDGRYVTADIHDRAGNDLSLAGYAHPRQGQSARIVWVD